MPRTASSGDDARVGSKVPSTLVDSSKGTGTTLLQKSAPASSSNVSDAGNTGGSALSKPPPKFSIRKLVVKRASA
jgi:hypothetical protein